MDQSRNALALWVIIVLPGQTYPQNALLAHTSPQNKHRPSKGACFALPVNIVPLLALGHQQDSPPLDIFAMVIVRQPLLTLVCTHPETSRLVEIYVLLGRSVLLDHRARLPALPARSKILLDNPWVVWDVLKGSFVQETHRRIWTTHVQQDIIARVYQACQNHVHRDRTKTLVVHWTSQHASAAIPESTVPGRVTVYLLAFVHRATIVGAVQMHRPLPVVTWAVPVLLATFVRRVWPSHSHVQVVTIVMAAVNSPVLAGQAIIAHKEVIHQLLEGREVPGGA
jgi:hypothetical protein